MSESISLHEHRSPVWRSLARALFAATLLLGCAWLLTADIFWAGVFRMLAFAALAGLVLVVLRLRKPPLDLRLDIDPTNLMVYYFLGGEKVKEELFERDTIKHIRKFPYAPALSFLKKNRTYTFRISFTDTDTVLNIFIYGGRTLLLNDKEASAFESFLAAHHLTPD